MNVFAKRALILTVLVLCLFGLTIFGVSAATGATEQGDNVASAVVEGETLYYADLGTALAEADTGSTVTVLKDHALASTVVIDRADATLTLDLCGKTVTTADGVSLAIRLTAGTLTIKNGTLTIEKGTGVELEWTFNFNSAKEKI